MNSNRSKSTVAETAGPNPHRLSLSESNNGEGGIRAAEIESQLAQRRSSLAPGFRRDQSMEVSGVLRPAPPPAVQPWQFPSTSAQHRSNSESQCPERHPDILPAVEIVAITIQSVRSNRVNFHRAQYSTQSRAPLVIAARRGRSNLATNAEIG